MTEHAGEPDDQSALAGAACVPIPPRYRWLKRFTLAGVCMLAGLIVLRLWWGYEADRRLQAEIARYRAAGQPVYAEEFDRKLDAVKPEDNAAILLEQAMSKAALKSTSGVRFDEFEYDPAKFRTDAAAAKELFEANAEVFESVHRALQEPEVAWSTRVRESQATRASGIGVEQRTLAKLLAFAAAYQRITGDHAGAVQTMDDGIAFCAVVEAHPTMRSHYVGMVSYIYSFESTENLLTGIHIGSAGERTSAVRPASVKQIQALLIRLLDEVDTREAAIRSHLGNRARELIFADSLDKYQPTGSLIADGWRRASRGALKPVLILETVRRMRSSTIIAEALAEPNWPAALQRTPASKDPKSNLVTALVHVRQANPDDTTEWIRMATEAYYRHLARRRLAATAVALALFEHDHGRRPASLAELVPEYVAFVPMDPFSPEDADISYRIDIEHPLLYSVGPNGRDDGGVDFVTSRDPAIGDIVFHLDGGEKWREAGLTGFSGQAGENHQDGQYDEGNANDDDSGQHGP